MKRTIPALYFFLTVLLSAAFVVFRTCMLLGGYDFENGFYASGAQHIVLRCALVALAAVSFVCGYIYNYIYNKKEENRPAFLPQTAATRITAFIAGAALMGYLLYGIGVLAVTDRIRIAGIFLAAFSVAGSFYYFSEKNFANRRAASRALLCASVALALLVIVFDLYFEKEVSYANQSVMLCFAAAIFLMLTLLAEANFSLGRADAFRRYFCYAPAAVLLSMTLTVPDLIAAAVLHRAVVFDIYYDIIIFAIGLHQLARLSAFSFAKEN